MGNHHDAEMTEMIVVLDKAYEEKLPEAVEKLKAAGMEIYSTDDDNSVVSGAAESCKLAAIRDLDCVNYVRQVMTWIADYPAGDARDLDGVEEE